MPQRPVTVSTPSLPSPSQDWGVSKVADPSGSPRIMVAIGKAVISISPSEARHMARVLNTLSGDA